MRDLNQVIITGRFGKDPEVKTTSSGKAYVNFSIANNQGYKDAAGNYVDKTNWIDCVAWDALAEKVIGKHCVKGTKCTIVGMLDTSSWTDSDGNNRHSTKVKVNEFYFADTKDTNSSVAQSQMQPTKSAQPQQRQQRQQTAPPQQQQVQSYEQYEDADVNTFESYSDYDDSIF